MSKTGGGGKREVELSLSVYSFLSSTVVIRNRLFSYLVDIYLHRYFSDARKSGLIISNMYLMCRVVSFDL